MTGLEALLRWEHPELGKVTPRHFLRLTEETDLMLPLGIWILQTATLQMQNWTQEEIKPLTIGVNISKRQLSQANFVSSVTKIIEQTGLSPELLELELKENCFYLNTRLFFQGRLLQRILSILHFHISQKYKRITFLEESSCFT